MVGHSETGPPRVTGLVCTQSFPATLSEPRLVHASSQALEPLVRAFRKPDGIVLDPFYGSGSPSSPAVWTAASSASHSTERMS